MADDLFGLTVDDRDKVRQIWAEFERWRAARGGRPAPDSGDDPFGPGIYVVRTPSGGIPALNEGATGTGSGDWLDDAPGYAGCSVHRLIGLDGGAKTLTHTGHTVTVYNLNGVSIPGDNWCHAVKDAWGTWEVLLLGFDYGTC